MDRLLKTNEYGILAKTTWVVAMLVTGAAIVLSIALVALAFSWPNMLALVSAITVLTFLSQYKFTLPKVPGEFSIKALFAIWAVIWIGPGGSVLVIAASSIIRYLLDRRSKSVRLFPVYIDIIATATAVVVVSMTLRGGFVEETLTPQLDLASAKLVVIGTILMTIVQLMVGAPLRVAFDRLQTDEDVARLFKRHLVQPAIASLPVAFIAIVLCFLFAHFGMEFGLVVCPLAVVASLAYSVHNTRLEQKTKQVTEASRIHLATVEALATAIDARDQMGLGHVRRTQIFAVGIGKLLGLPENDISALQTGALLHDIGKLAVPDHILNKPSKLTAAELEKTKIHAMVGASILEKIAFDCPVVPTVKYHHECWDGRGYPEGLKGKDIPLTARILAVADAFDTLRGARPYRPPLPHHEARQIIIDGAGSRFDPEIVDVFIGNLRLLEAQLRKEGLAYVDNPEAEHNFPRTKDDNFVEQIKLANREVFSLYELAREFSSSVNLSDTLEMFAKKVGEFVPFSTCALYLIEGDYAVATHVEGENAGPFSLRRINVGRGATGHAISSGQTVQNVDPDLDFTYAQPEFAGHYKTMAAVPLLANGNVIGAVTIYSRELTGYGEEHIRLLETISRIAADAIGKSLQHDEAQAHALTDPMTSLPNARSLQMQFEKEVARSSRAGTRFQLLMLDLDGFKSVNDSFGHKVGDEVLKGISKVIKAQLRDYDFLARYGGDEFVALIPETSVEDVTDLCDRIERAVSEFSLRVDENKFAFVGVSLGASSFPLHGESFDQLIVAADKAMYHRKSRRKQMPGHPAKNALQGLETQKPIPNNNPSVEAEIVLEDAIAIDTALEEGFIVEVDESHVVSSSLH